jgi:hypothetical protein
MKMLDFIKIMKGTREIPSSAGVRVTYEPFRSSLAKDIPELLECILELYPEKINRRDPSGESILMRACSIGSQRCVDLLIKKGADFSPNFEGFGPIEACLDTKNGISCMKILISHGCPVKCMLKVIRACVMMDFGESLSLLYPKSIGTISDRDVTDLIEGAIRHESYECLKVLASFNKLRPKILNFQNFMRCVEKKNTRMVLFFLTEGQSLFTKTKTGVCLLDFIMNSGWVECMEAILKFYSSREDLTFEGEFCFAEFRKVREGDKFERPDTSMDVQEFTVSPEELGIRQNLKPLSERESKSTQCFVLLLKYFEFTTIYDRRIVENPLHFTDARCCIEAVASVMSDYIDSVNILRDNRHLTPLINILSSSKIHPKTRVSISYQEIQENVKDEPVLFPKMMSLMSFRSVTRDGDENCPICLDSCRSEMMLSCGHAFCRDCIVQAMTNSLTCPLCRAKVEVKDMAHVKH